MKFGGGEGGAANGMSADGSIISDHEQAPAVWVGTTFGFTALLLSEGMKDEAYRTAWGLYHVIHESKGYSFRTPEAWDIDRTFALRCTCVRPRSVGGNDVITGRSNDQELSISCEPCSQTKSSLDRNSAHLKRTRGGKLVRGSPLADRQAGSRRLGRQQGLVAGVDIGGSNLRVAVADLHGKVLGRWNTSTKASSSPDMVIAQIEQGIDQLLRQSSCLHRSLLSVAAGAPGVTDPQTGVVLATSYLKGWREVPLQQLLQSALGVPAAVENDVRMAALGEHWMGAAHGVDDFVFLAIGTGIAAGVFANGKLIHGTNWTAGEVGYMHVPHATEEPARRGQPGSLESIIGGDGIRRQWSKACVDDARAQNLTATEIFARASSGDPLAKRVLDHSAQLLAYTVYNISLVLNSALFVLGGGIGVSIPLCDATKRILERYNEPSHPQLVISRLGTDAQLMGAIRLALTTAKHPVGSRV